MSLSSDRNAEARIIKDVIFSAELYALLRNNTEQERTEFIKKELPKYKARRYAYLNLKKVIKSGNPSRYCLALEREFSS